MIQLLLPVAKTQRGREHVKSFCTKAFFFFSPAVLGLGCIMQDLWSQYMDSLVVACRLSCSAACGIFVPQPGVKYVSPALHGDS